MLEKLGQSVLQLIGDWMREATNLAIPDETILIILTTIAVLIGLVVAWKLIKVIKWMTIVGACSALAIYVCW